RPNAHCRSREDTTSQTNKSLRPRQISAFTKANVVQSRSSHVCSAATRIVANGTGFPLCDKKETGETPLFDPSIVTKFFAGVAENLRHGFSAVLDREDI